MRDHRQMMSADNKSAPDTAPTTMAPIASGVKLRLRGVATRAALGGGFDPESSLWSNAGVEPFTQVVMLPGWTANGAEVALAPVLSKTRATMPCSTRSGVHVKRDAEMLVNGSATGASICPVGIRMDSAYGGAPPVHVNS